jgi:hypothetical protein
MKNKRLLKFTQITDDRFNGNKNQLEKIVQEIKEKLSLPGIQINITDIREVNFGTNKQWRADFYINKENPKFTWNDIYKIVNSVKAVSYHFE